MIAKARWQSRLDGRPRHGVSGQGPSVNKLACWPPKSSMAAAVTASGNWDTCFSRASALETLSERSNNLAKNMEGGFLVG